ncbi:hypothetical protein [Paenibacillus hamazuiensis]|uniref:hypothetical protein n=1 Tax=Paenibacillus hamazuiensis TaxID=2936508 RepID=UPI00200ED7BA|nr:hypothetical protein [Paenibacillus hamazuiensis]
MDTEKKPNREITYQVGWKRGKIRHESQDGTEQGRGKPDELPRTRIETVHLFLNRYLFRPVPTVSERLLPYVLWTLPAVSFFVCLTLVYILIRTA